MKNALLEILAYYEGIVVAEDNLGDAKSERVSWGKSEN